MIKLGRGGGEAVHRAVPSVLIRTVLMASPEDRAMAEEDWLESTPRPSGQRQPAYHSPRIAAALATPGSARRVLLARWSTPRHHDAANVVVAYAHGLLTRRLKLSAVGLLIL